MFGLRPLLLLALGGFGAVFAARWGRDIARQRALGQKAKADGDDPSGASTRPGLPSWPQTGVGLVTTVVLFFLTDFDKKKENSHSARARWTLTLTPLENGGGLLLHGRF